jgi:hypothetical protein
VRSPLTAVTRLLKGIWIPDHPIQAAVEGMKDYLKAMEPIEICAKRVHVTYEHTDLCVKLAEDSEDVTKISDKWAETLLGKIGVMGQERVRWERY